MTLVSSANIVGSGEILIVGRRSFICIMKIKGPRIEPYSQFEKVF
jgi:hypothetical protein